MDATLAELFRAAVAHASSRIKWYGRNAQTKAATARACARWCADPVRRRHDRADLGGLSVPDHQTFGTGAEPKTRSRTSCPAADWPELGYLLLAAAGALIIFDQFFELVGLMDPLSAVGGSLQVLLAEFRFAWAGLMAKCGGTVSDGTQVAAFTTLARDFVTKVEILAEEETGGLGAALHRAAEHLRSQPQPQGLAERRPPGGRRGQVLI